MRGGCLLVLVYVAAELAALLALAPRVGGWPTLILVLVVKAVAAWQLGQVWGRRAMRRAAEALEAGRPLDGGLIAGPAVMFGTLLLVPPAPILNLLGLLLLLPTRLLLVPLVRARLEAALRSGRFVMMDFGAGGMGGAPPGSARPGRPEVIDVDARTVDEPAAPDDPAEPDGGATTGPRRLPPGGT